MAADALVSVVIVSWNTRDLLRQCLSSTLEAAAGVGGRVDFVVVDNASSDGSAAMVRSEFPSVTVIANATNAGFAVATNQGIRHADASYVLLLNPDTRATPSFLRTLVAFLESHPEAGAAGPRIMGQHGEDQASCFPLPTLPRELWRLLHLDRLHAVAAYPLARWGSADPRAVESVQGSCMLIRNEALRRTGLLDEQFFVYTEEIDYCRRLLDGGWTIFWVPEAVIMHYGGASTEQVSGRMFVQLYRSKVQYFRKHRGLAGAVAYKAVLLAATLPRLLVPALAFAFVPSRRERWRGVLRNYSSLLMQLPAL
jgi:GT2 family glycosyltransferase